MRQRQTRSARGFVEVPVARHPRRLADLRHQVAGAGIPVAVDHEARHVGPDKRRIKLRGKVPGYAERARIPGNMRKARCLIEPQVAKLGRNAVRGMIAQQDEGPLRLRILDADHVAGMKRPGAIGCLVRQHSPLPRATAQQDTVPSNR